MAPTTPYTMTDPPSATSVQRADLMARPGM